MEIESSSECSTVTLGRSGKSCNPIENGVVNTVPDPGFLEGPLHTYMYIAWNLVGLYLLSRASMMNFDPRDGILQQEILCSSRGPLQVAVGITVPDCVMPAS